MFEKIITLRTYVITLISLMIVGLLVIIQYYIVKSEYNDAIKTTLSILSSVITAFVVGGAVQILSDKYLKKDEINRMQEVIKSQLSYYIPVIHDEESVDKFVGVKIADGLLNINLPTTINQKATTIIKMIFIGFKPNYLNPHCLEQISNILANKDSKIQILLLNPESYAFRARSTERRFLHYFEETKDIYDNFPQMFSDSFPNIDLDNQVEIKLYNDYPAFIYISVQNYIWFTPMWNKDSVKNKPYLSLNNDRSKLFKNFDNNFNKLWNDNPNDSLRIKDMKVLVEKLSAIDLKTN